MWLRFVDSLDRDIGLAGSVVHKAPKWSPGKRITNNAVPHIVSGVEQDVSPDSGSRDRANVIPPREAQVERHTRVDGFGSVRDTLHEVTATWHTGYACVYL